MAIRKHCQVGDKIHHEDYGTGMVVEVRPRPFFDILEVAFADGVRRLNSNHPKIKETPGNGSAPTGDSGGARRRTRASAAGKGIEPAATTVAPAGAPTAPMELVEVAAPEEPADGGIDFRANESLILDQDSLKEILAAKRTPKGSAAAFLFHMQAERLSLTRGFENLMALSAVHDLQRNEFQIQACLRVLRQMRGRADLAD